jgi:protein gp37
MKSSIEFKKIKKAEKGSKMSTKTKIEWTFGGMTWNPVGGCMPTSPACVNCYAVRMATRMSGDGKRYEGTVKNVKWTGKVNFHEDVLLEPLKRRKPKVIFTSSMGDLFYQDVTNVMLDRIFSIMAICDAHAEKNHLFIVLTKRPLRMRKYLSNPDIRERWAYAGAHLMENGDNFFDDISMTKGPLSNLWVGTTTENSEMFDSRIDDLVGTPAVKRFISAEPLLESLMDSTIEDRIDDIDWVICGGETGQKAREMLQEWPKELISLCKENKTPFFFKKWSKKLMPINQKSENTIDGKVYFQHPYHPILEGI